MRPSDAFGRPRPADNDDAPTMHAPSGPQMTYFLADEATVDASLEHPSPVAGRVRDSRKPLLVIKPEAAAVASSAAADKPAEAEEPASADDTAVDRTSTPATPSYRPYGTPMSHAQPSLSQPLTPILLGASGPASALSSSSSRRNSLEGSLSEEAGSRAASVTGESHMEPSSSMMDSGSAPQLVMPSIKMPSRRPFTDEGKSMGRLKIMVAGDSGTGKTSLIKAIVQSCAHIVHVDPITPMSTSLSIGASSRPKARTKRPRSDLATAQITEIYASTRPYPEWWTDVDDVRVLRRRKSLGDSVLDRNVCFVDTPGYGGGSSAMEIVTTVAQYMESYLQHLGSPLLGDLELLNLLSGDGGSHVDVVFYLISNRKSGSHPRAVIDELTSAAGLQPVDLEYLRRLGSMTSIIPLVAQTDTMSSEQLAETKRQIVSQLREADVRPFDFSVSPEMALRGSGITIPYAISSAPGSDHDTMDASLLMSPDYVQPLIPTELAGLVKQVFSQNGASWLRHAAARKVVQWRSSNGPPRPQALYRPLSLPAAVESIPGASISAPAAASGPATSFALAKMADHTHREERLAQIRLANWASELQRSLANERARYETLARSERAVWLTERLNEVVQDGTLVPVARRSRSSSGPQDQVRQKPASRRRRSSSKTLQHQDPLGLLEVAADLKTKSWLALEVLGSLGVIGGLAFWVTRQYGYSQSYEWVANEWSKFWNGES